MGIFDRFPYSSTHEMNLDFMLGKATEIAESLQQVQDGLSDIDTHKAQAEQAAQAAQASQAAASASAGQAAQHVTDAEDAADRAEAASTEAETAADRAETALGNITNAETVCTEAAEEAQQYAQASQSHSNQAMLYKNDAETAKNNAAVSASQAAISAGSAANSATDAASSASSANVSATNANLHASNAETSATNAATSATNAATSAANAAASANGIQVAADHVESLVESLPEDFTDLNNTVNQLSDEIDNKVNKPTRNPDGTSGQLLRTNGDGTTAWVNEGLPTDAQTAEAVSDWLGAHPEATTTVQDGALTEPKFTESLKLKTIKEYVTPEMYGAKGDGETDDTSAIQNAINSGKTVMFFGQKTYAVSTITISNGLTDIDFNGATLKAISTNTVLDVNPTTYISTIPNGFIKNLVIDMNETATVGMHVIYTWRKVYDNIIFINPSQNGIGLHVAGVNSCAGNTFNNIRGKGSTNGTILIKMDADDNYLHNIDYANYSIGLKSAYFVIVDVMHGYITNSVVYPNSIFVSLGSASILSNVYPDTQQYAFEFTGDTYGIIINNTILAFSSPLFPELMSNYPPSVVKASYAYNVQNVIFNGMILGSAAYTDANFSTLSDGTACFNISGFTVNTTNSKYALHRQGYEASWKADNKFTFKSALRNNFPVLYPERYVDEVTCIAEASNAQMAIWRKNRRFVPRIGQYAVTVYKKATDEYITGFVNVSINSSNEIIVKYSGSLAIDDIVFIDIPVSDYPTYYYN